MKTAVPIHVIRPSRIAGAVLRKSTLTPRAGGYTHHMIFGRLGHLAGLLAASLAASGRSLVNAWILFGTIAALLALFFIFVVLVVVARRQRRAAPRRRKKDEAPTVDPWAEAGQRIRPYPDQDRKR